METTISSRSTRPLAVLAAVCMAALALPLAFSGGAVATPAIGRDLSGSPVEMNWVTNAFMLTFGSLLMAAGTLVASLVARLRYPLEIVEEDMTPSLEWPMPKIVRDLEDEDGPVRVLIEYLVPEVNARMFGRLLRAREQRRRRNGAIEWDLYPECRK